MTGRLLMFTLAYDGTRYAGWQRQKNASSVQAALEEALRTVLGKRIQVFGAGRTDSGVHAVGQAAHTVIPNRLPLPKLRRALNALLPEDILVRSIRPAPKGFHARYSARSKWYRYQIWNHPLRPLFERRVVLHVPAPLDLKAMRRCARQLQGRRDFRAFCSKPGGAPGAASASRSHDSELTSGAASSSRSQAGRPAASTTRNLRRLTLTRKGPLLIIDAEADGFLYHMVRRIVGLLLEVGKGRVSPKAAALLVKAKGVRPLKDRGLTPPPTAPAKGLCLIRVRYKR